MVSRRESKGKEEKVATRGRRGLPLPTSRIPEMQIRPNYRRIVNPFCGGSSIPAGGRVRDNATGQDGTTEREGRGKRNSTRNRSRRYSAPSAHTQRCTRPCAAPRVSARHGWMHRVGAPLHLRVAATRRDRVADA